MRKLICIFLLFYSYVLSSEALTNIEINKAVKNYLKENNINNNFKINKKIKLPDCDKKLKIIKKFNSYKTLQIICPDKNNWKYTIRTKIVNSNKIKKKNKVNNSGLNVIKVSKDLKKGHQISESDIYIERIDRRGGSNYFSDKNEVLGRKAKITIRKDQILRDRHIEKNWTIKEGQKIIIENNRANVQILIDGIALNSAMKGEYMNVLNKSSGKKIKAWVKNNKKVSIFR